MLLLLATSAFLVLSPICLIHCSPMQARQENPSTVTTTCGPIITALASYADPTSFCSSWLGITIDTDHTVTAYMTTTLLLNRTTTSITGTQIITASSVPINVTTTVPPRIVTEIVATSTLTFCNTQLAIQRRFPASPDVSTITAAPSTSIPSFSGLPYFVQAFPPSVVSDACSCLSIPTAFPTVTSVRTALGDHVFVTGIAANVTSTPYYNSTVRVTPTSTTRVTQYATYIGASNGTIAPSYLPSPTPITTAGQTVDDTPFELSNLVFPVTFYGLSTSTLTVSPNGWIGLSPDSSLAFSNGPLPSWNSTNNTPPSILPDTAVIPFWDDLLIVNGTNPNPQSNLAQRMVYAIQGVAPSRTLTFEWVAGKYGDPSQHYRFWVTFFEDSPDTVRYTYWDVSDAGASATVGAEGESEDAYTQYLFGGVDEPGIWPGLVLDYSIAENRFVPSSIFEGLC